MNTDTIQIQSDLASYCRTGELKDIPGLTKGRVRHYRRLVFNVVSNTLEQAYPLSCDLLGEEAWNKIVNDFFSGHDAQSPQVWKLPLEFYEWAVENNQDEKTNFEFLNDLLLFEWLEIEVFTMPDIDLPAYRAYGDYLTDPLVINQEYRIIELSYPVHKVSLEKCIDHKGKYFLLAFREPSSKKVQFIELSIFYVFILERIISQGSGLADVLVEAVTAFKLENEMDINTKVKSFFEQLHTKGFILGFSK